MLAGSYIYSVLSTDSAVLNKTTAIYNSRIVPSTEKSYNTINFYQSGSLDGGLEYEQESWSIDCRSRKQSADANGKDAESIAQAVFDALNREFKSVGGKTYYGVCTILPAIPPQTDKDCYNVPVQLLVRRK